MLRKVKKAKKGGLLLALLDVPLYILENEGEEDRREKSNAKRLSFWRWR